MTYDCDKVGIEFFATAPTVHQARVEVDATPERVFDLLHDADAWVKWAFPITRVDWTSGFPLEVGSTRDVHMRGGLIGYEEFIAYERGVRMAFRFNEASKKGIKAFAEDYQVTDLGSGRCAIEWTMAMDTGRPAGVVDKVTGPLMGLGLKYMLGRFAKLIESDFAPAEIG
jgi:uncharacterized protein YndB with AHSA1/START domain